MFPIRSTRLLGCSERTRINWILSSSIARVNWVALEDFCVVPDLILQLQNNDVE